MIRRTRCNSKFAPKKVKAPKRPKIPKESVIVIKGQNDGNDRVKVTLEVRAEHNNSKKAAQNDNSDDYLELG